MSKKVICLTPVRNEAWILEPFLACASIWADHILLFDDASEDETRVIAGRFPKARVIGNPSRTFNEESRQQLLLSEGRKIPGEHIFVALDADEFLSANCLQSPDWSRLLNAPPGTLFNCEIFNVLPGFERGWLMPHGPLAFVDDGSPHVGKDIHSRRLPKRHGMSEIMLHDIKLLHYQYVDWARMQSKHAWYQCFESLREPWRSVALYRKYFHMDRIAARPSLTVPFERAWFSYYEEQGIPMRRFRRTAYWWDRAVVQMLLDHGPGHFSATAIWDRDWNALRATLVPEADRDLSDPRGIGQRLVHHYLRLTQPYNELRVVRGMDTLLKWLGW